MVLETKKTELCSVLKKTTMIEDSNRDVKGRRLSHMVTLYTAAGQLFKISRFYMSPNKFVLERFLIWSPQGGDKDPPIFPKSCIDHRASQNLKPKKNIFSQYILYSVHCSVYCRELASQEVRSENHICPRRAV